MSRIKVLNLSENPLFSIVTPLKTGDSISYATRESLDKCKLPFNWISVESDFNVMKNFDIGFYELLKRKQLAPKVIKIDNDTEWEENTLENMYYALEKSSKSVGYVYCSFSYKGFINSDFPAVEFDIEKLKIGNYISSNSMFKIKTIYDVGLVTEDRYERLLDWAFLLKCLKHNYIGVPCKGSFIAYSSENSVSARSKEDYNIKRERVLRDFL